KTWFNHQKESYWPSLDQSVIISQLNLISPSKLLLCLPKLFQARFCLGLIPEDNNFVFQPAALHTFLAKVVLFLSCYLLIFTGILLLACPRRHILPAPDKL